jgi:hypothetical protein
MCGFVFGCGLLPDDDTTPVEEIIEDIAKFKQKTSSRRTVLEVTLYFFHFLNCNRAKI